MKPGNETSLFPEGALPCVWMTAGLVAFKLCDRDFACEDCPLDSALGQVHRPPESDRSDRAGSVAWDFPADRSYHAGHGWVQELRRDQVRYGLDVLVVRLLDHLAGVILPPPGSRLRCDRPACWLADEGVLFPIRAPLSGQILRVNGRLQEAPGLLAESPYGEGWLMEVGCEGGLGGLSGLLTADELREQTAQQLKWLHERASRDLSEEQGIGPTLADGGERLTGLRTILGTRRYHCLVRQLLL